MHAFSEDTFYTALSNDHFTAAEAREHERAKYLFRYLERLGAKSIVVEHRYVDRDYLDDFAAYYVKCFCPYESRCKRLHFFASQLSGSELLAAVLGPPDRDQDLRANYLGFIVARPLPRSVIGRTVLRTFDDAGGRRHYTATYDYRANLFGIELSIPRSLAYQEQDTVLAACATVALWSSFQKAADLFGTPVRTPAAITQAATQSAHYGRPFPSHGLDTREMCVAVRSAGLEPELVDVTPNLPLVSLLYAYLKMGLPAILGVKVEGLGGHAIALAGYSLQPNPIPNRREGPAGALSVPMVGLRIDRLYGHDDQIGPFARLDVTPPATVGDIRYPACFESDWVDKSTGKKLALYPHVVIIPVYHKIRLTFLDVQKWVIRLHRVLDLVFPAGAALEWDIHLAFSNAYKEAARSLALRCLTTYERQRLLLGEHPRFIWTAGLSYGGRPMLELLFDATDIAYSFPAYATVWPDPAFAHQLQALLEAAPLRDLLVRYLTERFWKFLARSLRNSEAEAQPSFSF